MYFSGIPMVMDTRKQSKERAEAQAKAQAMEDSEDAKKKIPIHQAKIKRLNAKNKVKTALNQIKDAIEEFESTEDSTSKEVAADSINFCRMKLAEGEKELINATEDLAKMLAEADPTIVDSDVFKITAENETDKDKLLEDWKAVKRANQDTFKLAKDMADQSKVNDVIEIPS